MVNSEDSGTIIPFNVCKNINARPQPINTTIFHLDRTRVRVLGKLPNDFMRLSSNPKVTQTIDIYVVNIPSIYGMLLSRDWFSHLNGYFATDWSHLWLPWRG